MIPQRRISYIILFFAFLNVIYGASNVNKPDVTVKCLPNVVEVQLKQSDPFTGVFYVENHFKNDVCKKYFTTDVEPTFLVQHDPCTTNTNGTVSFNLIISNNTKYVDEHTLNFSIKCSYSNDLKKLTAKHLFHVILPLTNEKIIEPDNLNNTHRDISNVPPFWRTISEFLSSWILNNVINHLKSLFKSS